MDDLAVGQGHGAGGERLGIVGGAPAVLRGSGGKGLTPAQVARGVMLAGDVSRELGREINKRCKRT
ncbi:MAG TPA: hypothetical protein PK929_18535 [Quisquiliibacterium sp.]|nr:hypothetical protein [Quisquiliibacterium sp.]